MSKKIYLLDHKLKWKTFKTLHDKIVNDPGPTPVNMDKILWEMMRDKQIYCWYDEKMPDDMGIGIELPDGEITLITNPK